MAPVVHGFEEEYEGRIDFIYLNVAEERNGEAMRTYGFTSTPHFFFLRADGSPIGNLQGVLPAGRLRATLDSLTDSLVAGATSPARR